MDESIDVTGAAVTTQLLESMSIATYYFAIATVDSEGVQGEFSEAIQITL